MARLPVLQRRSKPKRAFTRASTQAKAWVIVKAHKVGFKGARHGHKAYRFAKGKSSPGRPSVKLLVVPVVAGGAALVWFKARSGSNGNGPERPLGPVATADSVSPPAARNDAAPTTPPVPQQTPTS
jgi:hypothetical protein